MFKSSVCGKEKDSVRSLCMAIKSIWSKCTLHLEIYIRGADAESGRWTLGHLAVFGLSLLASLCVGQESFWVPGCLWLDTPVVITHLFKVASQSLVDI